MNNPLASLPATDSLPNDGVIVEPAMKQCCEDCSNGRTACDETCIRATALADCLRTCNHNRLLAASTSSKCSVVKSKAGCSQTSATNDCCAKENVDDTVHSDAEEDSCCESAKNKACKVANCDDGCSNGADSDCNLKKNDELKVSKVDDCCSTVRAMDHMVKKRDDCHDGLFHEDCTSVNEDHCMSAAEVACNVTKAVDCCVNDKTTASIVAEKCASNTSGGEMSCDPTAKACSSGGATDSRAQDSCCKKSGDIAPKESCCAKDEDVTDTEHVSCSTISMEKEVLITDDQPCEGHLQQAFARYASYLELGKCICRDVLDRLDGCCGQPVSKEPAVADVTNISYGKSSSVAPQPSISRRRTTRKFCSQSSCATASPLPSSPSEAKGYPSKKPMMASGMLEQHSRSRSKVADVEGDAAREHVVLQVTGMTCTSCATKLSNVLDNLDGVLSPKVTFVTGTAEFDIDQSLAELPKVLPRLEKETGFKFSRILSDHQTLHLVIDPSVTLDTLQELQEMCDSVEKVQKTLYRITYDPAIVGARRIVSCGPGVSLAPPGSDVKLADGCNHLIRMLLSTGAAALLTIPVVVLAWGKTSVSYTAKSVVEFVLATGVQAIAVPEFYAGALKALVYSRVVEMDMLVVISITAAYGYSVVAFAMTHAGYTLEQGAFFETSSLLITLVLLGRLIAAFAKVRAISAVSVRSLQAEQATLIDASTGDSHEIDARLLQYGDVFLVPPHSSVVTDGDVIHGSSTVDESMLTGESLPVPKSVGDHVTAGTINGSGTLRVRLTRVPGKNSITDIANLVESALASKPRIQDLADKIAGYFVPTVVVLSLIVFAIWITVALKVRNESGGGAVGPAFTYSIAVLAISCPCALGLAVPMVLVIAGGVAARSGVIIKQADAIERGYKVTDVVFDKTGTITTGELNLVEQQIFRLPNLTEGEILSITLALTQDNNHPVSAAISSELKNRKIKQTKDINDLESIPSSGIRCTWGRHEVLAGNPFWLEIDDHPEVTRLIDDGMTLFCVLVASDLVAVFGLKSTLREEASTVIADLHHRKIACHIVSGDNARAVEDVARTVGISPTNFASRYQPAEKQKYIKDLMAAGKVVLFCGDGTNDATAVAQANIGVQIGATSDITRATADVVLLGGLEGLTSLLDLSKRSFRRITFNFVWSIVYNVFAILLAAGAFVKFRVPPAYAGLGEIVSVLPVIIVALTILRPKDA